MISIILYKVSGNVHSFIHMDVENSIPGPSGRLDLNRAQPVTAGRAVFFLRTFAVYNAAAPSDIPHTRKRPYQKYPHTAIGLASWTAKAGADCTRPIAS